jgi:hypothetical protein
MADEVRMDYSSTIGPNVCVIFKVCYDAEYRMSVWCKIQVIILASHQNGTSGSAESILRLRAKDTQGMANLQLAHQPTRRAQRKRVDKRA